MPRVALLTAVLALCGCHSTPPANTLEEGRSCILGAVPPSQVEQVRVWAEAAQKGDYLLNPACDAADRERELNDIRRDTR